MNNPRPTPETDAQCYDCEYRGDMGCKFTADAGKLRPDGEHVSADFARKLERERDILREAVKTANNDIIRIVQEGKASWETMKAVNSILSNLKPFLA